MAKQQLFDEQGNPIKKKKKWPFIVGAILVIAIIGSQAGGGEDKTPSNTTKPSQNVSQSTEVTTTPTTTATPTEAINGVGSVVTMNDVEVHFLSLTISEEADEGNVYLIPEFEIINNSEKEIAVSSILSFDFYIDGYSANTDFGGLMAAEGKQLDGSIAGGKKMKGIVACKAPEDWKELEIVFSPNAWSSKSITFTVNAGD